MSGSNKFSRGGGRGINRMVPPPPLGRGMVPLRRVQPPGGKEKGRSDEAAMKGRGVAMKGNSIGAASVGRSSQGEDFQLVSCQEQNAVPLYAMAIRLPPGMLETLKRVEEQGETSTMKFGHNTAGHVIKVGEEEFPFLSAPEPGQVCDIFEEQRRGEDGNGLLVEKGAVWRKLSVIRTLSATDKATVKARSVEAERQQKSRKAIILDHNNSLVNNKAAITGDANGRRAPVMIKGKKEPPQKKRKIVATAPVIPPLSTVKTRPMQTMAEKPPVPAAPSKPGKVSTPPEAPFSSSRPPPPQNSSMPPLKSKGAAAEEVGGSAKPAPATQKDKVSSPALAIGGETATVPKTSGVVNMSELRNSLITVLTENSKGMTIKAVEKALGEPRFNMRPDKRQIEKAIKAIASYHAPGKYMLKEGVEKGAFAKPSPGSGSSPETAPVDSPPVGDLPALMENAPEAQQEAAATVVSGEDRSVPLRQDPRRPDATSRNSSLPLRVGESAVTRAIRRAGEIIGEKRSGLEKSRTAVESSAFKPEDQNLKESTAGQDMADDIDTGGDESLVLGSPEHEHEGKLNGMEVENIDQDPENLASSHVLEADNKKENIDEDGSDSDSESGSGSESESSDSDSESASGSASRSASDSDSDAGSSSASEEENMDEDVDIISDDEDKPDADVVTTEAPKPKSKSKEVRASLERQESRVQKQISRGKKGQKQKGSDAGMTPHGSEDADIGDGAEGGETSKFLDQDAADKGKGSNCEEEVDVVSCGEDTPSPPEQRIISPVESGEHAIDPEFGLHSDFMEDVKGGQDTSIHAARPTRSDSESDHSIEEYETRAETSGVRGARANFIGDQKDDGLERKMDGSERVIAPQSKGFSGSKAQETLHSNERESKAEAEAIALTSKGSDLGDGPITSKDHLECAGVPFRSDNTQRSLLGTPAMPREDQVGALMYREPPAKGKAMELKRKNIEAGEIPERGPIGHRGPQRFNKTRKPPGGNRETPVKGSDGFSKPSEQPAVMWKGPETRENFTADRSAKASQDLDALERPDVQRRPNNRETGLLAKPGKPSNEKESKAAAAAIAPMSMSKGSDVGDGPITSKDHLEAAGVPFRSDNTQRSLLGTPPMPREDLVVPRMYREGPAKGKAMELKGKNVEIGEIPERGPIGHRGPQRFNKARKLPGGNRETPAVKGSNGFSKPSEQPGVMSKGSETTEDFTADRSVKASQDGDALERLDVNRRQNSREVGLLAKPGKASELNRGKPGREPKQLKKPIGKVDVSKRDELPERPLAGSEFREKPLKDTEVHSARLKDLDTDQSDSVKTSVTRMTSDLELGELRDIVAGEELRPKDSARPEAVKSRESSDLPSRQPQNKVHISPDKEKPRNTGKLGDVKRRSPADLKKQQQLAKKEIPKADVLVRDALRPVLGGQKRGAGHEDRLETGKNDRAVEAPKTHGDHNDKQPEGRNGKRLAEDVGNQDLGRPLKRTAFEHAAAAAATAFGRGELDANSHKPEKVFDATGKPSMEFVKSVSADGVLQQAGNNSKAMGDNGRVSGPKNKGQEAVGDKEHVEKRGSLPDGKQKTTAGLLGPGTKKYAQSNGKKGSIQSGDVQSKDFFASYEKRAAELRGPISNYDQYSEYFDEYREKYPVYVRLNAVLESDKADFEAFSSDINVAKQAEDKNKLGVLYGKVRKDYIQCVKRFKRMRKTFHILHEELQVIKQRIKDYAEMREQGGARGGVEGGSM